MKIVERDIQILHTIFLYAFLTARQLCLLFEMDIRRMNRRLKKLKDARLVNYVQRPFKHQHGKGEYVYFLTRKSAIEIMRNTNHSENLHYSGKDDILPISLNHGIEINNILITLSIACRNNGIYSTSFFAEHTMVKKDNRIQPFIQEEFTSSKGFPLVFTPDSVFSLNNSMSKKALFFLEVDLGTETIIGKNWEYSVLEKLRTYCDYRKCNKSNCRCMNGGALHGPYLRLYLPQAGTKTKRKVYLGKDEAGDFMEKFAALRREHLFGARNKRELMGWLNQGVRSSRLKPLHFLSLKQ